MPRVVGQTEQARIQKIGGNRSPEIPLDWDYYREWLQPERFALVRTLFERIEEAIRERGLGWAPKLTSRISASSVPATTTVSAWTSAAKVPSTSGSSCRRRLMSCAVSVTTSRTTNLTWRAGGMRTTSSGTGPSRLWRRFQT